MVEMTEAMREVFAAASQGEEEKDAFELRVTVDPSLGEEQLAFFRKVAQASLDEVPAPKTALPSLGIYCEQSPFLETRGCAPHQAVIVCCGSEAINLHRSPWVTKVELISKGPHIIEAMRSEHEARGLSLKSDVVELNQEIRTGEMWDGTRRHLSQATHLQKWKNILLMNWDNHIISLRPKSGGEPAVLEPA